MLPTYTRLLAHLVWADQRTLGALRDMPAPDPKALTLFAHILGAQVNWYSRIAGETPAVPIWPTLTLDECERLATTIHAQYEQRIETLDAEALARIVTYHNSTGATFHTAVADILMQVFQHSTYHRGQIAQLIRMAGATPVNTDFITFVRMMPSPTT